MNSRAPSQQTLLLGTKATRTKLGTPHRVAAARDGHCPRCGERLSVRYDEATCRMCGYADYGDLDLSWMERTSMVYTTSPGGYASGRPTKY